MSNQHQLRSAAPSGDINHISILSDNFLSLLDDSNYSDVTLVVEKRKFPVHRVILAARSEYFRALFFGGLKESSTNCTEIVLQGATAKSFESLVKYIYSGKINLSNLKEEQLLDILDVVHQYGFVELEESISEYLKAILNLSNVCMIYNIANLYNLADLSQTCMKYMDVNAKDVIKTDAFGSLSENAVYEILRRNSFYAPENEIFAAVVKWAANNPDTLKDRVINAVRLPLMDIEEILNTVRPTGLVSPDSLLDAIKTKTECKDMALNYRGMLLPEENVATLRYGAQIIRGEIRTALLDGDVASYDLDRGFSRHPIDDGFSQGGIVVQLAEPHIINRLRLLLWDRDLRSYSYFIECSIDDQDWVRIVDHCKFLCRSWQTLYFPARVAKYFRIVGTHNTVNRVFHAVSFECCYTSTPCSLEDGIVVPSENVATVQKCACVLEGVSRSRNALINGETINYDWDSGYTCHQLGSGCIIVQLSQPYLIESMRVLLWDCDDRSYSFTIEVSVDNQNWHLVADKRNEACRSWQTITFEKRPVTFVKIVGTQNTANEVFHCVHFECPADPEALRQHLAGGADEEIDGELAEENLVERAQNP